MKWRVDFTAGKIQPDSFDGSNYAGTIDVKLDGSALEEKLLFRILGLSFSSNLDWGLTLSLLLQILPKKLKP